VTTANSRPGAGWREWVGLAVLGLPTFLVTMDFSVLYLAVPHLTADLAPSSIQQLWIVDIPTRYPRPRLRAGVARRAYGGRPGYPSVAKGLFTHLPRETVWKVAGWVRSRVSLWREASKRASYIRFAGSWEREMEPLWSFQTVSRTGILGSLRSGFRRRFYLHAILRGGSQEPIDVLLFDERRGRKVGSRLAYFLEVLLQPRRY
jgi:hypothetical protein